MGDKIKTMRRDANVATSLELCMTTDIIDGEGCDTRVDFHGYVWIEGGCRENFIKDIKALVELYNL